MVEFEIEIPFSSFLLLAKVYSQNFNSQLLLSGDQPENKPSFLCLFPAEEIVISQEDSNPWETLKKKLILKNSHRIEWVGYLGYEMSAFSDLDKKIPFLKGPVPLAHFFKPSVICTYQKGKLLVQTFEGKKDEEVERQKFSSPKRMTELIGSLPKHFIEPLTSSAHFESDTLDSYLDKIREAKELIESGEIYQVNLSRNIHLKTEAKAFDLFYKLFKTNPVPFSALLNCKGHQIISASPESFLMKKGSLLETRPIKGTIQRGASPYEDVLLRKELLESKKEDAELSMICDLMRNDLGCISEAKSVKCLERKKMLELSNVFHLESTIVSKTFKKDPVDILRNCFPAGSITGCPKLRAQEVIQEIEKRPRHIYSGSIGYFQGNGDFNFNVAIRTALLKEGLLEVQLGGAITYDSDSYAEYKETAHKGSPFLKIFNNAAELAAQ